METALEIAIKNIEKLKDENQNLLNKIYDNPLNTDKINKETKYAINKEGVANFKYKWIIANQNAIKTAQELEIDFEHPQISAFIMSIVYATLESQNQ